jgi:small subunit ribosomal protein S6
LVIRRKAAVTEVSPIKASEGRDDRRPAPQREERALENSVEEDNSSDDSAE